MSGKPNTKITYMYRDAGNNKFHVEIVVAGTVTAEQIQPFVDNGADFIPFNLGLPCGQDQASEYESFPDDEMDHVFNSFYDADDGNIDPSCFEPTDQEPTVPVTAEQLVKLFEQHQSWDVGAAMEHFGIFC